MSISDFITGLQHIGIPAGDINASVSFYESLGFKIVHETRLDSAKVIYLEQKGLIIELYETDNPALAAGAIDHIAINVSDIEAVFELAKEKGYIITDGGGINFLPFWDNGIKYIMLEGPSKERVELIQIL